MVRTVDRIPDGVCVVTQPARREGGKTHAHQLLNILSEITDVVLLTANLEPDSGIRDDYEVVELSERGMGDTIPMAAVRFILNQLRMCAAILRRDEEVVLFFGATAYLLPVLFTRALGRTIVVQPRGNVPLSLQLAWEERAPVVLASSLASIVATFEQIGYYAADAIITYTPSMAEQLELDRFKHKLYTNGARYVDNGKFSPTMSFEEREDQVGFIGRLDVEKGMPELAAVAKNLPDDLVFIFVGDGDYYEWLKAELCEERDAGTVEFTGRVDHDEVPTQLNRLKLLLLPSSQTEGLPTIILEAFACGTPVYATPVSGVPDVVREGETGFLLKMVDADAIADDITHKLEHGNLEEISANCRSLAEREFSFDAAVKRYQTILTAVQR